MSDTSQPKVGRNLARDAYRGFIVLLLVAHDFGFGDLRE
jgi:hypothetical protein